MNWIDWPQPRARRVLCIPVLVSVISNDSPLSNTVFVRGVIPQVFNQLLKTFPIYTSNHFGHNPQQFSVSESRSLHQILQHRPALSGGAHTVSIKVAYIGRFRKGQ